MRANCRVRRPRQNPFDPSVFLPFPQRARVRVKRLAEARRKTFRERKPNLCRRSGGGKALFSSAPSWPVCRDWPHRDVASQRWGTIRDGQLTLPERLRRKETCRGHPLFRRRGRKRHSIALRTGRHSGENDGLRKPHVGVFRFFQIRAFRSSLSHVCRAKPPLPPLASSVLPPHQLRFLIKLVTGS